MSSATRYTTNPYAAPGDVDYERLDGADADNWLNRNFLWLLFSLRGRIPRLAYWTAFGMTTFIAFATMFVAFKFLHSRESLMLVKALVWLPLAWSSVAIQVKRLHDREKSGAWWFLGFVPLIGPLWLFCELGFCRGTYGANSYGNET